MSHWYHPNALFTPKHQLLLTESLFNSPTTYFTISLMVPAKKTALKQHKLTSLAFLAQILSLIRKQSH